MEDKIQLKAYAKINLLLDVVGKYKNNYHKVKMVMQSINLADRLNFTRTEQGITINCNHASVPEEKENLIYQAAELLLSEFDLAGGLHVRVDKNIPVAAGLAGGSSNAAATLVAVNQLWDLGLTTAELECRAAKLGSDVPFCISGGTQLATGTGTELEKINVQPNLNLIVVNPPLEVATAEVYNHFSEEDVSKPPQLNKLITGLKNNNQKVILANLDNLLELVTLNRYSKIGALKELVAKKTDRALMSGSGPTILGFVATEERAKKVVSELKEELNPDYKICSANTVDEGVEVL
ncbi:MAG: 4-(cytidine 5'-diphospho)-2-C-methyl-D-erythritol kinase [Bacillota bacterium]